MNRFALILAASLNLCALAHAQPNVPPVASRVAAPGVAEAEPLIDPQAERFVEQMVARYAALKSYSDVTYLYLSTPEKLTMNFRATLQWERPAYIRFEGHNSKGAFLALGTPEVMRVVSPDYPGYYVAQPRSQPVVNSPEDIALGIVSEPEPIRLEEPLMGYSVSGFPGAGFMLDAGYWKRVQKDVRALGFDADATVDGEVCRVVRIEFLGDAGLKSLSRVFVAKSDGLIRRIEDRHEQMPDGSFIVETHHYVKSDIDLPGDNWYFTPPQAATPIDYFSRLDEAKDAPTLKIGDALPTFSADALDGAPLELNAQSGKVTVVYFFNMAMSISDAQILRKIQQVVGPDKLQVVGVSGDGLRPRVEKWAEATRLNYPIYFDESGMKNALARKFGVKSWTQVFVFGADGKLKFIDRHIIGVEFQQNLRALLPQIGRNDYVLQDDEYFQAP